MHTCSQWLLLRICTACDCCFLFSLGCLGYPSPPSPTPSTNSGYRESPLMQRRRMERKFRTWPSSARCVWWGEGSCGVCGTARCMLLRPIYTICITVCNYCYVSIIYVVHVATVQSGFCSDSAKWLNTVLESVCVRTLIQSNPRCSTRSIYTCNRHSYEKHVWEVISKYHVTQVGNPEVEPHPAAWPLQSSDHRHTCLWSDSP